MSKEIIVSIICTTYNHEKYICDALNSFLNQKTNFSFEVLVHDDASTDGTTKIIKKFEKAFPNTIKAIYQTENQFSKNVDIIYDILVPRAKGKYLAFCEGDDYWTDNNKLQKCVDFIRNHIEYDAIFHDTNVFNCLTGDTGPLLGLDERIPREYTFYDALSNKCHTSSFFVKKTALPTKKPSYFYTLDKVGDFPLKIYLTDSYKVFYFSECMSLYRLFSNSQSFSSNYKSNKNYSYILDCIKMMNTLKGNVKKSNYKYVKERKLELYWILAADSRSLFAYFSIGYFLVYFRRVFLHIIKKFKNDGSSNNM